MTKPRSPFRTDYTIESLCKLLRLELPAIFAAKAQLTPYYPRRSGRTTTLILNAVVAAQHSKVLILGHSQAYSRHQLMPIARTICQTAGISCQNIIGAGENYWIPCSEPISDSLLRLQLDPNEVQVFEDHYRLECGLDYEEGKIMKHHRYKGISTP